jgi:hypothetical protein
MKRGATREPQPAHQHFTPWADGPERSCWTCTHAIGYDGVHLWCQQHRLVVIDPCGWWERGAGCDSGTD